jgi:hypothetical protein
VMATIGLNHYPVPPFSFLPVEIASAPAEWLGNRVAPAADPSLAKGNPSQFSVGEDASPADQDLVPSAPPEYTDTGAGVPQGLPCGALGINPYAAPELGVTYPVTEEAACGKGVPGAPPLPPAASPAPLTVQCAPVLCTLPYSLAYGEDPVAIAEVHAEESTV